MSNPTDGKGTDEISAPDETTIPDEVTAQALAQDAARQALEDTFGFQRRLLNRAVAVICQLTAKQPEEVLQLLVGTLDEEFADAFIHGLDTLEVVVTEKAPAKAELYTPPKPTLVATTKDGIVLR